MSFSNFDDDHLMVSYIDERVAMDALVQLVHDDRAPADEYLLFPFDAFWKTTQEPVIGYSVPPSLPV